MTVHHKRGKNRTVTLNMVSLMDIFTILVFFLLVNTVDSEVLHSPKQVTLPDSTSEKHPKENIIIIVNSKEISVQGKPVAKTSTAMRSKNNIIPALSRALDQQALHPKDRRLNEKQVRKRGITIMGDKEIPFQLLKKVMLTCASSKFTNISLAVVQKIPEQKS